MLILDMKMGRRRTRRREQCIRRAGWVHDYVRVRSGRYGRENLKASALFLPRGSCLCSSCALKMVCYVRLCFKFHECIHIHNNHQYPDYLYSIRIRSALPLIHTGSGR